MSGSNPFARAFLQRLENRYSDDSISMSMTDWVCRNTKMKGRPFSTLGYPFQKAILDDLHENMDVIKISQVGLSEIQIRKILGFLVRHQGTTAIFTLPNDKLMKRMSQTRVTPIVNGNKVFNSELDRDSVRSMGIIQLQKSFLYVTGATEGDATSTSADAVFNDEVDLTDPAMLALFNSRLQNSNWKIRQRFSTPSHPSYGIDLSFGGSDQHELMCRCGACGHWQLPLFTRDFCEIPGLPDFVADLAEIDQAVADELDLDQAFVRCEKCQAPLDLGNPDFREWVAKYPTRRHARGYRIRPFSTSKMDVKYIVQQLLDYKKRDNIRGWYNTVLGEAHSDSNSRIPEAAIRACFTEQSIVPDVGRDRPVWVGIDAGLTCHLTLGTGFSEADMHVFSFESMPVEQLVPRVVEICDTYNVICGAMDRHPYTPTANDVFAASKGKIFPVEYRGQKELNPIKDLVSEEIVYWQGNRTTMLDEVQRRVNRAQMKFSGFGHYQTVIVEHLRDMVRDEQPEQPAKWIKLTGNDHFFHSLAELLCAFKIRRVMDGMVEQEPREEVRIISVDSKPSSGHIYGFTGKTRAFSGLGLTR